MPSEEWSWFRQRWAQRFRRRRRLWIEGAGAAIPILPAPAFSLALFLGIGPFLGLEPAAVEVPGRSVLSWLEVGR